MPLLGATGAVADHICSVCGLERHLTSGDWIMHPDASDAFGTPPCPACTSQEWFTWHDWTYESERIEGEGDEQRRVRYFDPEHPGARQMVLIERIAQAKGRTRRTIHDQPPGRSYPEAPRAPTQAEVREMVARLRGES